MQSRILHLTSILILLLLSCSDGGYEDTPSSYSDGNGNSGNQSGVITAGEWNDLDNWSFWENLMSSDDYVTMPQYWSFFNNNRIAVHLTTSDQTPVINAKIALKRDGNTIFTARTDNKGKAELWADLFQFNPKPDFSKFTIDINDGANIVSTVKPYKDGVNNIVIPVSNVENKIELSFVVDATGSMGDELDFLKTELLDVILKIKSANANSAVLTSSVYYRDKGDDYVTKVSQFNTDISKTLNFIKDQSAGGGGDFPEAVHSALDKAINELQWSTNAKTRILFLILDAPPHHDNTIISNLQTSVVKAAEKGIKIIPISASGIDKETEFLLRFISNTTNGTYVFITDDSGVGNPHLQPSVGEYEVEYLNDLMVRLINKYAE